MPPRSRATLLQRTPPAPAPTTNGELDPAAFTQKVAENLHRLRLQRRLTLDELSAASHVSRAMLSQVEAQKAIPTIAVLWKIATGLRVPFSTLLGSDAPTADVVMRRQGASLLYSGDRRFASRPLFRADPARRVELYEITLAPRARSDSEPHASGTTENVFVVSGCLRLTVAERIHLLGPGDAIEFRADVPHRYENAKRDRCVFVDVITYG